MCYLGRNLVERCYLSVDGDMLLIIVEHVIGKEHRIIDDPVESLPDDSS